MKCLVLGSGSWSTAIACVLAAKGSEVEMWCRREERRDELRARRHSFLPGVELPPGIGAACATRLAADGAAVTICGRTEAKLEATAKSIEVLTKHGGSIHHIVGDVTHESDVERIVARAAEPTGALDGCIANAGGGGAHQAQERNPDSIHGASETPGFADR